MENTSQHTDIQSKEAEIDAAVHASNTNVKRTKLNETQVEAVCAIIKELQEKNNGEPPSWLMIRQHWNKMSAEQLKEVGIDFTIHWKHISNGLYMTDKVYSDKDLCYVSLNKHNDEFMTYSEWFKARYSEQGYYLDQYQRLRAGKDTLQVNYAQLIDFLKSKDESIFQQNASLFEGDRKFLDMHAKDTVGSMHNMITYCSYPRMGNSFLRMYL